MDEKLMQKGKDIIENVLYITLATVDAHGNPWNSPVFTAFDKKLMTSLSISGLK